MKNPCYIGLMSGTSLDGVDGVIASFAPHLIIHAHHHQAYPDDIKAALTELITDQQATLQTIGTLEQALSEQYALAINALHKKSITQNLSIQATGCHGQTIYHQPIGPYPFSWQLVNGNYLAQRTQLTTVIDFRQMDMAYGGQGAPLAPLFHNAIFRHPKISRAIVNIGGIANVSILQPDQPFLGFDTGPGNTLLDQWINQYLQQPYDHSGIWAAQGQISQTLLDKLLAHPYFAQPFPKSTGREIFNITWLNQQLADMTLSEMDVQTTLTELTAMTIANAITPFDKIQEIYLCGGGAYNHYLVERLTELTGLSIQTTQALGIAPDQAEAALIAWLTQQRVEQYRLPLTHDNKQHGLFGVIYQP